ncbi:Pls/PosA family non-ribosomal peptide synthetase [Streptomyces purpurogeneiscleroticus]|uniref:Pls/PosA family non-ribosomal peptide synthetase n=1 Tax=Streptomyces purpurogeneiscleroticus TaxID=68259 RepID=UPI003557A993
MVGKPVKTATVQLDAPSPGVARAERSAPAIDVEDALAEVLAGVVRIDRVSVDSHFFDDLGADSLVMAQFCARVRKQNHLPSVSMKDIYRYPTIRSLATALGGPSDTADAATVPAESPLVTADVLTPAPRSTPQYVLCGALQLLAFLGYAYLTALVLSFGYDWISAGTGLLDSYLRAVLFGGAVFLGVCTLPILAKWALIGRWKPQQIRIWSLAYFRFWLVKILIQINPLVLFAGSPLFVLYLKALGAHIGRGVAIFSKHVPVCTDLLAIGDNTVIRKDAYLGCYRAEAGWIRTGPVTVGTDVHISESTVLDIDSSLGDGAQLGHASSLHSGQRVPAGERWHGTPAQRTEVDYRTTIAATGCTAFTKVTYSLAQLLTAVAVYVPLAIGGASLLLKEIPQFSALTITRPSSMASWEFYREALIVSFVLFFGSLIVGLLLVTTVPRLLHLAIKPDHAYPLYGFRYSLLRTITRLTNNKFLLRLAGDSSLVVHYLRGLGYDLSRVEQTGSNFGTELKHEDPFLTTVGTGTMVADGLSVMNTEYTATSFRVRRVTIGPHNFLGNQVAYPPEGKTGNNCLLATKVMVPIDGPVREGIGLLGSPSFEIPRTVERDASFDHLKAEEELRRHLHAKNKHNAVTLLSFLLARWIYTFGLLLLVWGAASFYASSGAVAIALATMLTLAFSAVYTGLMERISNKFRQQKALFCSIYDRSFWRHERFWKHQAIDMRLLNGTPFKSLWWRLLGVHLGRRLFDDGCKMPERTLVTIGDDCTLNVGTVIQCHSQEDGSFKSDHTSLGAGCTLGVNTLVHYGVTIGDDVVLGPDSFLMKGEEVPAHARWAGNPAKEITVRASR